MKTKILLIMSCIFLLTGCVTSSDKQELNVLNWSSYIPDSVVRSFEKETGITVNYSTYSSNEELLAKISASKEGTYDLIFPSDYMVEIMHNRELIEEMDKSKLSNISNLNPDYMGEYYDPANRYTLPFLIATTVIAYNTNIIKDSITSYKDLLNSKYKDNIVILDDQRTIIGMALLAMGYDMNETDETKLQEAAEWLLELKPNIKAFDSDSPKNFLISKEVGIAVLWNAEAALAMEENPAIKTIYPSEGMTISMDNFAIPKGAKNKESLYKFIDYILRADVMKKIIESYPYKNVNAETEKLLSYVYLNNNAANVPDEIIANGYFTRNIGDSVKVYDKMWAEIK